MRRLGYASVLVGWLLALGCQPHYGHLPLAPPLAYSIGEDQLRRGDTEEAIHTFREYLDSGQPTYRARALYQLARAQYMSENYPAALESLSQLEQEFPDLDDKQANALRGDIAYATAHRLDAVLLWEKAYVKSLPSEREALEPRIRAAVDGMTENEAVELANLATVPAIYDMAIDRLPSAAVPGERRDRPIATVEDLDEPASGAPQAAAAPAIGPTAGESLPAAASEESAAVVPVEVETDRSETVVMVSEAPSQVAEDGRGPHIACLLPLTGSDREAGRLALGQLRRAFTGSSAHLIVRDSGSDADLAARLTGQLAEDPTVLAIIGPLSAAEVARATAVAKATGLPMLPLNEAAGIDDVPRQAQRAADSVLESIEVAGDDTRDRVRETLLQKNDPEAPASSVVR